MQTVYVPDAKRLDFIFYLIKRKRKRKIPHSSVSESRVTYWYPFRGIKWIGKLLLLIGNGHTHIVILCCWHLKSFECASSSLAKEEEEEISIVRVSKLPIPSLCRGGRNKSSTRKATATRTARHTLVCMCCWQMEMERQQWSCVCDTIEREKKGGTRDEGWFLLFPSVRRVLLYSGIKDLKKEEEELK